jgi:hypothetical protein
MNLFTSTRLPKSPVGFVSQRKQYNENILITLKMTKELNPQKPNCATNLQHPYENAHEFYGVPAARYSTLFYVIPLFILACSRWPAGLIPPPRSRKQAYNHECEPRSGE